MPSSKNVWSYTSTPQYAFMAWCLVKHRDNFTFYYRGSGVEVTCILEGHITSEGICKGIRK
jgi:hypothetical protein